MTHIRICEDPGEAQRIWEQSWPRHELWDLWQVRACFAAHYDRPLHFLVAGHAGQTVGLAALCWVSEEQLYAHFPGELWHGKTWLEQNRLLASHPAARAALLESLPPSTHLRYLTRDSLPAALVTEDTLDEVGYLFEPGLHGNSYASYLQAFSSKTRKKLRRELGRLQDLGVTYRIDERSDVELLLRLNLGAFGEDSYFHDPRFQRSFLDLVAWLDTQGMLRVTTVLLGGAVAAVDVGAIYRSNYTVLAGGTSADFPGVAKLINLFHIEWACEQRLALVDFLCGEFQWKHRFHLTPRPLYEIRVPAAGALGAIAS